MTTLFIVEYKAFQPIHETNILGNDPITKKDDATGIIITMTKRLLADNNGAVFNIIIENPNNIPNTITGNLEIPFPEKNVKSQIIKINNIIEFLLIAKSFQENEMQTTAPIEAPNKNNVDDFITVPKKTFADKVRNIGDVKILSKDSSKDLSKVKMRDTQTKPSSQLNMYKNIINKVEVNTTVNPKLKKSLKTIIDAYREEINKDRCFKCNEKSNCLIVASYKNSETVDICKQCKNKLALGAKELNIEDYKCINCSDIVYIGDNGYPNHTKCNSCLSHSKK